jgi:hypothetical protein
MLLHAPSNPITKARSRCTKSPPAPYCCKATCPLLGRKLKGFEKHGKKVVPLMSGAAASNKAVGEFTKEGAVDP